MHTLPLLECGVVITLKGIAPSSSLPFSFSLSQGIFQDVQIVLERVSLPLPFLSLLLLMHTSGSSHLANITKTLITSTTPLYTRMRERIVCDHV